MPSRWAFSGGWTSSLVRSSHLRMISCDLICEHACQHTLRSSRVNTKSLPEYLLWKSEVNSGMPDSVSTWQTRICTKTILIYIDMLTVSQTRKQRYRQKPFWSPAEFHVPKYAQTIIIWQTHPGATVKKEFSPRPSIISFQYSRVKYR